MASHVRLLPLFIRVTPHVAGCLNAFFSVAERSLLDAGDGDTGVGDNGVGFIATAPVEKEHHMKILKVLITVLGLNSFSVAAANSIPEAQGHFVVCENCSENQAHITIKMLSEVLPESASSMTRPTPYLSNGDFFAASTSGCADTAAPAWL
jgi:hypothetical protein